jgi:hypothetical protein
LAGNEYTYVASVQDNMASWDQLLVETREPNTADECHMCLDPCVSSSSRAVAKHQCGHSVHTQCKGETTVCLVCDIPFQALALDEESKESGTSVKVRLQEETSPASPWAPYSFPPFQAGPNVLAVCPVGADPIPVTVPSIKETALQMVEDQVRSLGKLPEDVDLHWIFAGKQFHDKTMTLAGMGLNLDSKMHVVLRRKRTGESECVAECV